MVKKHAAWLWILAVGTGVSVWVSACHGPTPSSSREPEAADRSPVSPAARHAVHTARLQAVMARLGRRVAREWPQEIAELKAAQERSDWRGRIQDARRTAEALAQAAAAIPDSIADAPMSEVDRQAFMANVELLAHQARELDAAAAAEDVQLMRAVLSRIQTTCYGCHTRFREVAGPLHFGPD